MKLSDVIAELTEERGLDRAALALIIAEGILAAYQKKYPDIELAADYDEKSDEIKITANKQIVSSVEDEDSQISVRRARHFNTKANAGETIWVPFEGAVGRIEILRARQIIASKIRHMEADAVYKEFKDKEGTIVYGVVHKCERGGVVVKLRDNLAFLPQSLSVPGDKCVVGFSVRALLKEVLAEPRNENQLILDRSSDQFLAKLFELEVPEVFERLVEVKKIVRIPGYKSKVAVISHDKNIDPVGTCVGVGGVRIKPILKELGGEKIDVIPWSDSTEDLIINALKPAHVNRVELIDSRSADIWLDEDQRSLAIGKMGQNIALASRMTGVDLQLVPSKAKESAVLESAEQETPVLDAEEAD